MRLRRTIAAVVLVAAAGCGADDAHATASETIAAVDGASLTRVTFRDGSHAYLQLIDPLRVRVHQVTGGLDASSQAGRYYPGAASPHFTRIPPRQVQDGCRSGFSVINFSFFEEYDPGTRLSFPLKSGGTVLTGGSSPYGPVDAPADPYYRTVTLQALTWKDLGAAIAPYLWQASLGELVPITNSDGKLPHYLCFVPRPAQSP